MKTSTTRQTITIVTILSASLLGGCLTKEESTSNFAGNEVQTQNNPPTISGTPPTAVTIGKSYSLTPTASDPDGDVLTFSVQNMPSWASFDTTTGRLSGTPTLADVGTYGNVHQGAGDAG